MLAKHVFDIEREVLLCLDREQPSRSLNGFRANTKQHRLEKLIHSCVLEAIETIHMAAPATLLDGGYDFSDNLYWYEDTPTGWMLLPEDFMRLVVFKMSDWARAVYEAKVDGGEDWAAQNSKYGGVRATPERPQCAIGIRPEGRVLEFRSCKDQTATVDRAVYIPRPRVDRFGYVEVCGRCYNAVVHLTASRVARVCGDEQTAAALLELSKQHLAS